MTKLNYAIDTTLLPEVWVTWLSKDGRIWMNNEGKRQTHPESWMLYTGENTNHRYIVDEKIPMGCTWSTRRKNKIWVPSGTKLYYAYVKYHSDIDRLELAAVKYDTTRRDGQHEWTFDGDRMFIGRDKTVLNQDEQKTYTFTVRSNGYWGLNAKDAIGSILRVNTNDLITQEFKKFLGTSYFTIGNGTSVNVEHPWHIIRWYESVQKTRSNGKAQRLVDELVKMPLGQIGHLSSQYRPKTRDKDYYRDKGTIPNIIYFERVNDKLSVLRGLMRDDSDNFDEIWRIYLGDDGTTRIVSKSNGDWIPSSQQRGWDFSREYYFANPDEATQKCNRIKYILPIFEESDKLEAFITALRFPIIEQLYKLDCHKIAKTIAHSHTPKAEIKQIFGNYYKEKENGVLRQLGMTKHQLDMYYQLNNQGNPQALKKMRETFGDDLSHIDNTTFDKYMITFDAMLSDWWSARLIDMLNIDKSKFWRNTARLGEKNSNTYRLIKDTIEVYNRLYNSRPEIDWMFDSYSDIVRAHDALTALYNEQEAERRAYYNLAEAEKRKKDEERRKKVDAERKCYEYEDDNFIIRLPKDVQEIINEGAKQSICIGGYTTRHSHGDTNLFFLRKKDAEDTPFYAIEMNPYKTIVQIHGHSNKWLGNNPEAIPTVVRWLRKHNIKCDDAILTCTARGYGRTADYIEMPIVD